jgi:DNA-binding transcriptional LysR family regulator
MSLRGLDANLLVYLQALLEEENVARAARRAGLSQSGMSRALTRLRIHFDDPLFVATGRGVRATPFAKSLLRPLDESLGALGRVFELRASFDPRHSQRTFRVASADYSTLLLLAPLSRIASAEAPGIALDVRPIDRSVAELLDVPELDLVIGPPVQKRPGVVSKVLFTEDFCLVLRPGHPISRGRLTLERYANASHVLVSPGRQPGAVMDKALEDARLRRRITIELPSFLNVPAFLRDGDMVATLPRALARVFTKTAGLVMRELPIPSPTFPVTLAFQREHDRDPGHRWFRRMVTDAAAPYRRSM